MFYYTNQAAAGADRPDGTRAVGRIDTHVHVASGDTRRYPRQPTGVGSDWWQRPGYEADDVLETLAGAGVSRFVAVQAVGVYGYDNRYVISAAQAHPDRVSAVVSVDMDADGAPAEIERLGGSSGVVGVRLFAVRPGSSWVAGSAALAAFEAAAAAGLTVVLTVFSSQLPALRPVIDRSPTPPVVLDHCGFPQFADGLVADDDPVLGLAGSAHVSLKISSHVLRQSGEDPARLVDQLARVFGAGRLMWGSDYPQSEHESYGQLVDLGERSLRHLGPAEQDAVWQLNAAPLFGLSTDP